MLNLVQLQERLKDVPMQALMQYANGTNPQVPPFLALGELNRRKKMQEGAAAEQAAEMEGAPTVKQQIEQAAGLMALQGNRQRQAAQQQAGIQAAMPMAAPNTTTSEPAQLAGGGFIDDIVVPRDYQGGGMAMNPEMIKKLMMLKAMQQRKAGVAGLPVNKDMFKRSDYAGGGIVAFSPGGVAKYNGTFDSFIPDESGNAISAPPSAPGYARSDQLTATKEQIAAMSLAELQKYYKTGEIPERLRSVSQPPRQVSPTDQPRPPAAQGSGRASEDTSSAVSEFLKIKPSEALKDIARPKAEEYKAEREGLNRLFGVSADPYAELKRRYGEIEAEDTRTRAEQPMDQLSAFLRGVASGPRGGTFGTQGAAGAAVSAKLREEQRALNRKQALDMAGLRAAITEKEDARARGDRDAFIAADEKIKDFNRNLVKDRIELERSQAQIENQRTQARASMMQAEQVGAGAEGRRAVLIQQAYQKRLDADPNIKILALSTDPKDKAKLEEIKRKALADAIAEVQAIQNSLQGGNLTGLQAPSNVIRYDAQGNRIQ
jgi:hypothetical protein